MVYIPPSREVLHHATAQLVKRFNLLVHRYTPPPYDLLREKTLKLKALYSQGVAEKPLSFFGSQPVENPIHVGEIECITRLVLDLPVTRAGTPEQDEVHNVILGALMYRYFAIEFDYTKTLDGRLLSWVGLYNKDSAALYKTLKALLDIHEHNELDDLSIATRCSAYLDHLRIKEARRGSAYILKEEVNFFERLQRFITEAQHSSKPIAEQIKYLAMIQFIDDLLFKTGAEICTGFELFSEALSRAFKVTDSFSRVQMMLCLNTMPQKPAALVIAMIDYLLQDNEVLKKENLPNFVVDMKRRLTTYNQYALLGIYVIALTKSISPVFTKTLQTAIGVLEPDDILDDHTRINALSVIKHYLQLPKIADSELAASPLGGYLLLQDDIAQLLSELSGVDEILELNVI